MYAQACFYSQQAGEKAVKALWYMLDADPWGHSVQRLILDFPHRSDISDVDIWIEWGAALDKFYIPTRYPNGLHGTYPRANIPQGRRSARNRRGPEVG